MESLELVPIGFFQCAHTEKYMAPRQPEMGLQERGKVVLNPGHNFEQALCDLSGFERIWLIYAFHHNQGWKPKVSTPRGGARRGVFSTRSPHRPNPLGISCVELLGVKGREVSVGKNDLLDGTPIFDIKPYVTYADAFLGSRQGWLDEEPLILYELKWSSKAFDQAQFIENASISGFINTVMQRLKDAPYPIPGHRIKTLEDGFYLLSFKTWRIRYTVEGIAVTIESIFSGYDAPTLKGEKSSRWEDVPVHLQFLQLFPDDGQEER